MNPIEFISFIETPNEKHLGIATIKLYGKIFIKYKIVPNKDGSGFFPSAPSYKITKDGNDIYTPAFLVDSRGEEEEIKEIIHSAVKSALRTQKNYQMSASIALPNLELKAANEEIPF